MFYHVSIYSYKSVNVRVQRKSEALPALPTPMSLTRRMQHAVLKDHRMAAQAKKAAKDPLHMQPNISCVLPVTYNDLLAFSSICI